MSTPQRINTVEFGEITVVTFNDSKILNEQEIQELGQELYDLVEKDGRKKIILNFGAVEFLSSAALGKLIGFEKRIKLNSAELMLTNIRPEIYEVFAITKLTKLFEIKDGKTLKFDKKKLTQSIMETDLTYEDLAMTFLYWKNALNHY